MNKVLTSYFTSKIDPQRDRYRQIENFNLMRDWWDSLRDIGLEGMIFHDELSREFRARHDSDQITYRKVSLGSRSINDERFYHYRDYLEENEGIENVLLTDLFDLEFFGNPFELFENCHSVYCNGEGERIGENGWAQDKLGGMRATAADFNLPAGFKGKELLNPGILGGKRQTIQKILENMIDLMDDLPVSFNANMIVFNLIVYNLFEDAEIKRGYPLHSKYKAYESGSEKFCIRHK